MDVILLTSLHVGLLFLPIRCHGWVRVGKFTQSSSIHANLEYAGTRIATYHVHAFAGAAVSRAHHDAGR
jgi:hypothetical protein